MYQISKNVELDGATLARFIALHQNDCKRYKRLEDQYLSRPQELMRRPKKDLYKPDNRITANFARYMIDSFNGYFCGNPAKVYHSEPEVQAVLQDFWRRNEMDDVLSELSKLTSLYGRAYLFVYQDEDAETNIAYNAPYDMFVIYSKDIKPQSMYGVRYTTDDEGVISGEIYEKDRWYYFQIVEGLNGEAELITTEPVTDDGSYYGNLYYGRVPIIEFSDNEERTSLIEPVESLINAYHKAISEKANDVDYFADAYLSILGAALDDEAVKKLRDNRIINISSDGSQNLRVEFLSKPDGDQTQEHLLDRLEYLIYTVGMVSNLNTSSDKSTPTSGEALKVKQQPMSNLARVKERKFSSSLRTLLRMYCALPTNIAPQYRDAYIDAEITWKRNTPHNLSDEVKIVQGLEGIVSERTRLSQLSIVSDVDAEMNQMEIELIRQEQSDIEQTE